MVKLCMQLSNMVKLCMQPSGWLVQFRLKYKYVIPKYLWHVTLIQDITLGFRDSHI